MVIKKANLERQVMTLTVPFSVLVFPFFCDAYAENRADSSCEMGETHLQQIIRKETAVLERKLRSKSRKRVTPRKRKSCQGRRRSSSRTRTRSFGKGQIVSRSRSRGLAAPKLGKIVEHVLKSKIFRVLCVLAFGAKVAEYIFNHPRTQKFLFDQIIDLIDRDLSETKRGRALLFAWEHMNDVAYILPRVSYLISAVLAYRHLRSAIMRKYVKDVPT